MSFFPSWKNSISWLYSAGNESESHDNSSHMPVGTAATEGSCRKTRGADAFDSSHGFLMNCSSRVYGAPSSTHSPLSSLLKSLPLIFLIIFLSFSIQQENSFCFAKMTSTSGVQIQDSASIEHTGGSKDGNSPTNLAQVLQNGYHDDAEDSSLRMHPHDQLHNAENDNKVLNSDSKVLFDPPFLAFNASPLCITSISSINLININHKENISILSVSTNSLHFHPSILVQQSVAEPGGKNAIINIIFLPRHVGKISDATLVVQTNVGPFVYHMSGEGVPNDYRITPILNHKLPVEVDYRKPIHIYNPHDETLLIKEIYTSELFLLLGLPEQSADHVQDGGEAGSSKATSAIRRNPNVAGTLWTIPPHSSKTVIFLNFKTKQPGTYHGFVHLKTNFDPIIVHVEFIVSKNGVHRVMDELDFGTFISPAERRTREITLLNSSPKPVVVSDVYTSSPDSQLHINFMRGKVLPPETVSSAATVTFTGDTEGDFFGTILFKTNDSVQVGSRIEVPYKARVIYGSLDYSAGSNVFFVGPQHDEEKKHDASASVVGSQKESVFTFMNKFSLPVQFTSAVVEDESTYSVSGFESGRILHPSEQVNMLSVRVHTNDTNMLQRSNLVIETNITRISVPLFCFHGNLNFEPVDDTTSSTVGGTTVSLSGEENATQNEVLTGDSSQKTILVEEEESDSGASQGINFGILELEKEKYFDFYLSNPNPVLVDIFDWKLHFSKESNLCEENEVSVDFVRMVLDDRTNTYIAAPASDDSAESTTRKHDSSISLQSGDRVLMRVTVHTTTVCEQRGHIIFDTTYRKVKVPLEFIVMEGSLSFLSTKYHFADAFPGRIQKLPVFVENSYSRDISIASVLSGDSRFEFVAHSKIITSNVSGSGSSEIGYVQFNPSASDLLKKINYMRDKRHNRKSAQSYEFAAVVTPDEINNYIQRRSQFRGMQRRRETKVHSTLTIKTDVLKTYTLKLSAELVFPSLTNVGKIFDMGRVRVGEGPISRMITIRNPSEQPLHVKLLIGNDALKSSLLTEYRQDPTMFSKYSQFSIASDSGEDIATAIIDPSSEKELGPIMFSPDYIGDAHAVLYIRNNLTIFDVVQLNAVGGNGELIFLQSGKPTRELNFHISDAQSSASKRFLSKEGEEKPSDDSSASGEGSTVYSQVFTILNSGNDDLTILKSSLSDGSGLGTSTDKGSVADCSLHGVKLHNCGKITLRPGEKKSFHISYEPDFSSASLKLDIVFDTTQGVITYPVVFSVPSNMLPFFSQLPGGSATRMTSVRSVITLLILFIGVGVIAYIAKELKNAERKASVRSKLSEMEDVESANVIHQQDSSTEELESSSEDENLSEPVVSIKKKPSIKKKSKRISKQKLNIAREVQKIRSSPSPSEKNSDDVRLDIAQEKDSVPVGSDETMEQDSVIDVQPSHQNNIEQERAQKQPSPGTKENGGVSDTTSTSPALSASERNSVAGIGSSPPSSDSLKKESKSKAKKQSTQVKSSSAASEHVQEKTETKSPIRAKSASRAAALQQKGSRSSTPKKTNTVAARAPNKQKSGSKKASSVNTQKAPATQKSSTTAKTGKSGRSFSATSQAHPVRDRKRSTSSSSSDKSSSERSSPSQPRSTSRSNASVDKPKHRGAGYSDPERRIYRSKSYESRKAQAREARLARKKAQEQKLQHQKNDQQQQRSAHRSASNGSSTSSHRTGSSSVLSSPNQSPPVSSISSHQMQQQQSHHQHRLHKISPEKLTVNPPNLQDGDSVSVHTASSANAALESQYESLFTPTSMLPGASSASSLGPRGVPSWTDSFHGNNRRRVHQISSADNSPMFSLFQHGAPSQELFSQPSVQPESSIFSNHRSSSTHQPQPRQVQSNPNRSLFEQNDPYDFFMSDKKTPNKPMELFFKNTGSGDDLAKDVFKKNQK